MIIKASVRAPGGLTRHLLRSDTNEHVAIGQARDVEAHAGEALRHFAALGDAAGCTKSLMHVSMNPDAGERPLNEQEWEHAWATYEHEFGLVRAPFVEVRHVKRRRAHRHRVYCRVDPDTGRVARDSFLRIRNEKVARILEAEFGHEITPGKHDVAVRRAIAEERPELLETIRGELRVRSARPVLGPEEMQHAERVGADARVFRQLVWASYASAEGDWKKFAAGLDRHGITVARGTRAILVVDEATGFPVSLLRLLRGEARAAGQAIELTNVEVQRVFSRALPYAAEREAGFQRARDRAENAEFIENFATRFEALSAADLRGLQREQDERRAKEQRQAAETEAQRLTLEQERQRIRVLHQRVRDTRRRRVDRAYRIARIASSPAARKLATAMTGLGILMLGLGLGPAFAGALFIRHGLAPVLKLRARRIARREPVRSRSEPQRRESEPSRSTQVRPRGFNFNEVVREDRPLAGLYTGWILAGSPGEERGIGEACQAALGAATVRGLAALVESGTPKQLEIVRSWYQPDLSRHRAAASAALRRHGLHEAALRVSGGLNQNRSGGVER